MTAIMACGSAIAQSGSKLGPHIAYNPAPYAFEYHTDFGTLAEDIADIIFAPWRIPCRSMAAHHDQAHRPSRATDVEPIAKRDESRRFICRIYKKNTTLVLGVVCYDTDRLAVESG